MNEPGQSEREDVASISEEEEPTPRPKRTALKTQVVDDGISELASSDDPDWEMSPGDNDKGKLDELDSTDLGTMEEDITDVHISDPEGSPQQQKNKASLSKSSKGKEKDRLRDAISQERQRKSPMVRHTRG